MIKTLNAIQIKALFTILFNKYLKLPVKLGRSFDDTYICPNCEEIYEEAINCKCKKPIKKKKPRKKSKKQKTKILKAIKKTI